LRRAKRHRTRTAASEVREEAKICVYRSTVAARARYCIKYICGAAAVTKTRHNETGTRNVSQIV
jgi:hypothetical protein